MVQCRCILGNQKDAGRLYPGPDEASSTVWKHNLCTPCMVKNLQQTRKFMHDRPIYKTGILLVSQDMFEARWIVIFAVKMK